MTPSAPHALHCPAPSEPPPHLGSHLGSHRTAPSSIPPPHTHLGIHRTTGPLPMALPSAYTDMAFMPGTSTPPRTRDMRPPTPPGSVEVWEGVTVRVHRYTSLTKNTPFSRSTPVHTCSQEHGHGAILDLQVHTRSYLPPCPQEHGHGAPLDLQVHTSSYLLPGTWARHAPRSRGPAAPRR